MDRRTYLSSEIWSLPFIFVRDFPGNVFIKASTIHPELARGARQLRDDFPSFYTDISSEIPDENER